MNKVAHTSSRVLIALGALLAGSNLGFAQADAQNEFGKGLQLLAPGEFAKLPKTATYRAFLPERTDLSSRFPLPGDQGKEGSCVAWAVGYAARAYYAGAAEGRDVRKMSNVPSPGFIYDSVVATPNDCISGLIITNALDFLKLKGSMSYSDYPYHPLHCSRPAQNLTARATDFRIDDWLAVDFDDVDQVKGELAKGNPVIIGLKRTTLAFDHLKKNQIYQIDADARSASNRTSGHAVTVVGYDERRQAFHLINSWGASWGDGGYGWISYDTFKSEVGEAYVMRPLRPVVPEPQQIVIVRPPPVPPTIVVVDPTKRPIPVPPVRPSIEVVTDPTTCGKVKVDEDGGNTILTGYVGSDADLARLSEQAQVAKATVKATVRPWPQCEVLSTLNKALSEADKPVVRIENAAKAAETGDYLRFRITTPAYPSFLHVAYLQADGSVVNLIQPGNMDLTAYAPSSTVVLGDSAGTGPKFKVQPPFGHEMLVVIASRSPIFDAPRPVQESNRDFLTSLRKALIAKPDPTAAERIVAAGFDTVTTSDSAIILTEPQQ